MTKTKRTLALILLITALIGVTAQAALTDETITVSTGVNIKINGTSFKPTDVNGNEVEAFLYNGTTYLPARAISEVFGAQVEWNPATAAVSITSAGAKLNNTTAARPQTALTDKTITAAQGVTVYFNDAKVTPVNANNAPVPVFLYSGTTYLPVRDLSTRLGLDIAWDATTATVNLTEKNPDNYNEYQREMLRIIEEADAYIVQIDAYYVRFEEIRPRLAKIAGNAIRVSQNTTYENDKARMIQINGELNEVYDLVKSGLDTKHAYEQTVNLYTYERNQNLANFSAVGETEMSGVRALLGNNLRPRYKNFTDINSRSTDEILNASTAEIIAAASRANYTLTW